MPDLTPYAQQILLGLWQLERAHNFRWWSRDSIASVIQSRAMPKRTDLRRLAERGLVVTELSTLPTGDELRVACDYFEEGADSHTAMFLDLLRRGADVVADLHLRHLLPESWGLTPSGVKVCAELPVVSLTVKQRTELDRCAWELFYRGLREQPREDVA